MNPSNNTTIAGAKLSSNSDEQHDGRRKYQIGVNENEVANYGGS